MLEKLNEQPLPIKAVMALVLAAILGGAGYYFLVIPVQDKNKADTVALVTKQNENRELSAFEPKLGELDRQIAALKQQMELQRKIVPDEKEADKFIILLQETASDSGISLRNLQAKPIVSREYYTEVPFGIEIDGPFYGVLKFFEKLAGQTRIVNVDSLAMKSLGKGSQYPVSPTDSVTVSAVAKTFFSHDVSSAPAPAAAAAKK